MVLRGSTLLVAFGTMLLLMAGMLVFAESASAHGYVESPTSRAYLCKQGDNTNCGQVQYEPQSVEGPGKFPAEGPPDGQIAGGTVFPELDEQTADRWKKVNLNGGKNTFKWHLTAPHSTTDWRYYITKKDWDPNKPLGRDALELEPFCSFEDGGARPSPSVTHECNVPTDRSGYHLILAVWEIDDTPMAFYQVIDVNLNNGNPGDDPEQPGDDPEQPGDDPEQPGDDPEQPGDDPEQPGDDPEQPGNEGDWQAQASYQVGDQITYQGKTYTCIQAHTSQEGWEPPNVPALWGEAEGSDYGAEPEQQKSFWETLRSFFGWGD
ncbi:lytic polysaccharide monooxygenase [Desmospora profundinema]|uniref:Carbohydrate-binding protein with CBM5 and CBM33 domain n=1 Tax=Desmospora profundinema TaxID=1571184 RepID=A0ABU1IL28_9BACL|nr:lytic polysaccharide monooxygenase [Desmospora profundinema]MDR6225478.1 putative carbohydrate-binding protein with CBM5 and CBM33 domain [Desmospora profundinema]